MKESIPSTGCTNRDAVGRAQLLCAGTRISRLSRESHISRRPSLGIYHFVACGPSLQSTAIQEMSMPQLLHAAAHVSSVGTTGEGAVTEGNEDAGIARSLASLSRTSPWPWAAQVRLWGLVRLWGQDWKHLSQNEVCFEGIRPDCLRQQFGKMLNQYEADPDFALRLKALAEPQRRDVQRKLLTIGRSRRPGAMLRSTR